MAAQYALDRWRPPPAPIAEQLNGIVRDAARAGLRVAETTEADLHGSGETSRILVLRSALRSERKRPDELRIYDVSAGRLRLRFRFAPTPSREVTLRLAEVADIDGNGSTEIVASLDEIYIEYDTTSPALVGWDPRTDTYGISPMLTPDGTKLGGPTRPRVVPHGRPAYVIATPREFYVNPIRIRDAVTGRSFRTYAVESFTIRRSTFSTHLVAAFTAGTDRRGVIYDLNVWSLADLGLPPLLYPCTDRDGRTLSIAFRTRADESEAVAVGRAWRSHRRELSC